MKTAIIEYLEKCGGIASLQEIARDALKLVNMGGQATEALIKSILEDTPEIELMPDGRWRLDIVQPDKVSTDYIICHITPERSVTCREWTSLQLIAFSNEIRVDQLILSDIGKSFLESDKKWLQTMQAVKAFISDRILIVNGFGNQAAQLAKCILLYTGPGLENPVISLKKLAARLFPGNVIKDSETLCKLINLPYLFDATPDQQMDLSCLQFFELFDKCRQIGVKSIFDLIEYQNPVIHSAELDGCGFDREFLLGLPEQPGIYIMKDGQGKVIYVGKSVNLFSRVNSYFQNTSKLDQKTRDIRKDVYNIEIHLTGSEVEALLLEQENIEKFRPRFNTMLEVRSRLQDDFNDQIVFLPRVMLSVQRVLCTKSDNSYIFFDLFDIENIKTMQEIMDFFTNRNTGTDMKYPLVASWLSANRHLNCIELKNIVSLTDIPRLVRDYLKSLENGHTPVIQI